MSTRTIFEANVGRAVGVTGGARKPAGRIGMPNLKLCSSIRKSGVKRLERVAAFPFVPSGGGAGESLDPNLVELLEAVGNGELTPSEAAQTFQTAYTPKKNGATVESAEEAQPANLAKPNFPEIVWGVGKASQQIADQMLALSKIQRVVMATRIEPEVYAHVRKLVPGVEYHGGGKVLTLRMPKKDGLVEFPKLPGSVAILTTDTADLTVAEECRLVAEHAGCYCFKVPNVGLDDLSANLSALSAASLVVVATGLDSSLPSILSGLIDCPVISLPTSAAHGASLSAVTNILSALTATAPGVTTVNVDNGTAAAFSATRVLKTADKIIEHRKQHAVQMAMNEVKRSAPLAVNGNGNSTGNGMNGTGNGMNGHVDEDGSVSGVLNGKNESNGVLDGLVINGNGKTTLGRLSKPLLGLLIFQTGAILPKVLPIGLGAAVMLT